MNSKTLIKPIAFAFALAVAAFAIVWCATGASTAQATESSQKFIDIAAEVHQQFKDEGYTYSDQNGKKYTTVPDGSKRTDCSAYVSYVMYLYLAQTGQEDAMPKYQMKSWDFANVALKLSGKDHAWYGGVSHRMSEEELDAISEYFDVVYVRTGASHELEDQDAIQTGDILIYTSGLYSDGHVEIFVNQETKAKKKKKKKTTLTVFSCGKNDKEIGADTVTETKSRSLDDVDYVLRPKATYNKVRVVNRAPVVTVNQQDSNILLSIHDGDGVDSLKAIAVNLSDPEHPIDLTSLAGEQDQAQVEGQASVDSDLESILVPSSLFKEGTSTMITVEAKDGSKHQASITRSFTITAPEEKEEGFEYQINRPAVLTFLPSEEDFSTTATFQAEDKDGLSSLYVRGSRLTEDGKTQAVRKTAQPEGAKSTIDFSVGSLKETKGKVKVTLFASDGDASSCETLWMSVKGSIVQ